MNNLCKLPEDLQFMIALHDMLEAFAPSGTVTCVTQEQGAALDRARALLEGRRDEFARLLWERIIAPVDSMPFCSSPDCPDHCHVHKPAVAAALLDSWLERGSRRADAARASDDLSETTFALHRLASSIKSGDMADRIRIFADSIWATARDLDKESK